MAGPICDVCGNYLDADTYVVQVTEKAGMSNFNFKNYDCCQRCGMSIANNIESRRRRYNQR